MERRSRHRYYQLAGNQIAYAIESLGSISTPEPYRPSGATQALCCARACCDHLAGTLAVRLAAAFELKRLIVAQGKRDYELTTNGESFLREWHVDVDELRRARRSFARRCLDWTERKDHLEQVSLELQFARDYSSSAGSGETTGPAQSTYPGPANVNWLPSWNENRRPYRDVRKPHFGVCLKTSLPRSPGFVLRKGGKEMPAGDIDFEVITPKILYLGTPVAIVSSANDDGTPNLAPLSSFWALGWTMVLGLLRDTKTLQNLEHRPECVVNLPSPEQWQQVELLAPLTGLNPVPAEKAAKFHYEPDKFAAAGFSPLASDRVSVPRVRECPAQLEAIVRRIHPLEGDTRLRQLTGGVAVEVEILRVHLRRDFILKGDYVDPTRWQPLIYNFRHYYGLGSELGTFRAEI